METPGVSEDDARVGVPEAEATLDVLRARLQAESKPGHQYGTLRKLATRGTPEALDLLFERVFEDPAAFGAEMIWSLVHDVDDPRVYQLARGEFERALADGLSGPRHTEGYLRLIASHGGTAGAELLLSQVFAEGPVRAREAAQAVGHLADRSHADAYLHALTDPAVEGKRFIGRGLVHWQDPYVTEELLGLGRSSRVEETLRQALVHALGYGARSAADVDAVVTLYWSTGEEDVPGVRVAVDGLRGLQENPWIDRDVVVSRATDVLNHLLTTRHWRQGVSFIAAYPEWKTAETKQALEALLAHLEDPSDRSRVSAELLSFP